MQRCTEIVNPNEGSEQSVRVQQWSNPFSIPDVFLPEGSTVTPNQFLHELPSYQSLVRRRPSNYGTMESRRSIRPKQSLSRGLSHVEAADTDLTTPPREFALSMQEKRQLR